MVFVLRGWYYDLGNYTHKYTMILKYVLSYTLT